MSQPDTHPPTPVFAEPWQAQAFAMVVALHGRGVITWSEWSAALAREIAHPIADHVAQDDAYGHWLRALEDMVVAKGLATKAALAQMCSACEQAAHATPHGQAIMLPDGI